MKTKQKQRVIRKISRTIAMRPAEWDRLDALRGGQARGRWVACSIALAERDPEIRKECSA